MLELVPKGACRFVMMNGSFGVTDVRRVIVKPAELLKTEHPVIWVRIITIETEEGDYDLRLEASNAKALQLEPEGNSIFRAVKKQVTG